jgi:hypothetical protein
MAEHPRLNDLGRRADRSRDDADRVLYRYPGNGRIHQGANKLQRGLLPAVCTLLFKPPRPTDAQVIAGRESDHQIPLSLRDDVSNVPLEMVVVIRCWQQIARPSIVPTLAEGTAHDPGFLAGNQHSHGRTKLAAESPDDFAFGAFSLIWYPAAIIRRSCACMSARCLRSRSSVAGLLLS